MNKRSSYVDPRSTPDLRLRVAGASRYITHLAVLLIIIAAVLLATASLPRASGATPVKPTVAAIRTLPIKNAKPVAIRDQAPDDAGSANASSEDAIVRSFAPITNTTQSQADNNTASQSRGLITYTVQSGDTLFGIAAAYGLAPETVLWSNYGTLKDNPDLLSVGVDLLIPPSDGLITDVLQGDTLDLLARRFKVKPEDIVNESINGLTSINQALVVGQELSVPGGQRETVVWQVPKPVEVRQTTTGVKVYRVGTCGEVAIPALGSGRFGYPANAHYLSGYNFSAWHPGLDFAGHLGDPIYAADSGTVIYAGYSLSNGFPVGYGQYVVLDHGNGYQTLYAHASQLFVKCGQQVLKGTQIAAVGSVGNSTGPHLHFEIRSGGTALNPWNNLPAP